MAMTISKKPYFFIKGNFLSHLLPLAFFSQSCVCSQSCACCVLKCLCALVWILDVWIIASKKIPFFFFFSSPFLIFFPPLCFFPSLLPCLVALSSLPRRFTPLLHCLILLSSSYYFITFLCFVLFHCLVPSYFALPCCLAISLPSSFKYLLTPPFVASLPCCFTPCCVVLCYLIPYVGWHFLPPSSLARRSLEFGGANSLAPKEKVIFFVLCFLLYVFLFPSSFFVLDLFFALFWFYFFYSLNMFV